MHFLIVCINWWSNFFELIQSLYHTTVQASFVGGHVPGIFDTYPPFSMASAGLLGDTIMMIHQTYMIIFKNSRRLFVYERSEWFYLCYANILAACCSSKYRLRIYWHEMKINVVLSISWMPSLWIWKCVCSTRRRLRIKTKVDTNKTR